MEIIDFIITAILCINILINGFEKNLNGICGWSLALVFYITLILS